MIERAPILENAFAGDKESDSRFDIGDVVVDLRSAHCFRV